MPKGKRCKKEAFAKASDTAETSSVYEESSDEETIDLSAVMAAIASSENKILARIDSSIADLNTKIDALREDTAKQEVRLNELESGLNTYSDRTATTENEVAMLKAEATSLRQKMEEIDGGQRRFNARLVGIKEGFELSEGRRPTASIAELLQELLSLNFIPTLDAAYRGARRANEGGPPRVIVIRFHYLRERDEVFRTAARLAPLTLHDKRVSIFPDYTVMVARKRAAFAEAKRLLRSCQNVKFGVRFPAVLRITDSAGRERRFEDPATAVEYIKENLKPKDTVG